MKFLLAIILPLLLCQNLYGQSDTDFKKVIEDCIRRKQDTGKVVYIDTASLIDPVIKLVLKRKKIRGMINDSARSNIFLTRPERKFIVQKSLSKEKAVWRDSLFNQARKTSENYSIYESRRNYKIKYFAFSKPIFIRNNSICLFQLIYMFSAEGGYKQLYFYKKENDIWEKWIMIPLGAW
jgi:hypothetical protein